MPRSVTRVQESSGARRAKGWESQGRRALATARVPVTFAALLRHSPTAPTTRPRPPPAPAPRCGQQLRPWRMLLSPLCETVREHRPREAGPGLAMTPGERRARQRLEQDARCWKRPGSRRADARAPGPWLCALGPDGCVRES